MSLVAARRFAPSAWSKQVLAERGRRALRVHWAKDLAAGLAGLSAAFHQALT